MRAYRLNETSWTRLVTARVRRPSAVVARMSTRRRSDRPIPVDGRLMLLRADHAVDPRTGLAVGRRELLDRLVEALTITGVDGVIGPLDVLEDLTMLNVLERRLVIATGVAPGVAVAPEHLIDARVDAAQISSDGTHRDVLATSVRGVHAAGLAVLAEIVRPDGVETDHELEWHEWLGPVASVTASVSTGAGVWLSLPPITGASRLAEHAAIPALLRDTDVPIDPETWGELFSRPMPNTIRGLVAGATALFPLEGSVGAATAAVAAAIHPA